MSWILFLIDVFIIIDAFFLKMVAYNKKSNIEIKLKGSCYRNAKI